MTDAKISFKPKEAKIIEELKEHFNQECFNRPEAIRKIASLRGRHNRPAGFDQSLFDKMNEAGLVAINPKTRLYAFTKLPYIIQEQPKKRNRTFKERLIYTY